MTKINQIHSLLQEKKSENSSLKMFFKTEKGSYAEHDLFMGITVPNIRKIAQQFKDLPLSDIKTLLYSKFNEERLLALIILAAQYEKASEEEKEKLYTFYIKHISQVNNWNLVDASAHLIVGSHLYEKDKDLLTKLANSKNLWEKRIAMVATLYFIRKSSLEWTFKIARTLLNDSHDLIHKASGWMLREAGKKNEADLIEFLDQYAAQMPRTMLRYAIEKLPESKRKHYLSQ
jgi:3-methyladenine DNA glycosylase AlkD